MFFIFTSLPKAVGISYIGNPKVSSSSFSSSLLDPLSSSYLVFLPTFLLILSPSNLALSTASLVSLSNLSLSSPLLFGSISSSQSTKNSLFHSGDSIPSLIDWLDWICVCLEFFLKDGSLFFSCTSGVSGLVVEILFQCCF